MSGWVTRLVEDMGYVGVALLMLLENVFPPIPSEVVMPLAGYTASTGDLSLAGVIASGTLGSVAGAVLWYGVGRWASERWLKDQASRRGRWLTLGPRDIDRVNDRFRRHGGRMVLFGRVIPAVRTLISIPAGLFCMPFGRFLALSTVGTLAWTAGLAAAGYLLGEQYEAVQRYVGPVTWVVVGGLVAWYAYRVVTFRG